MRCKALQGIDQAGMIAVGLTEHVHHKTRAAHRQRTMRRGYVAVEFGKKLQQRVVLGVGKKFDISPTTAPAKVTALADPLHAVPRQKNAYLRQRNADFIDPHLPTNCGSVLSRLLHREEGEQRQPDSDNKQPPFTNGKEGDNDASVLSLTHLTGSL